MSKYTDEKSNVISLFLNEIMLTNLFFLPIQLTSFSHYTMVYGENSTSVLGLNKATVELWQSTHELVLRDFIQFKKQLSSLQKYLNDLPHYASKAKNSDFENRYLRKISQTIDQMIQFELLKPSGSIDSYVLSIPTIESPYVQLEALLKFKVVDLHLLKSGQATLTDFISLTNSEAKKISANLKKLARIENIIGALNPNNFPAFHLNLGIHPLHLSKFTQEQLQYYHQQLKIWMRHKVPHIEFISIARNDVHKGFNIHLFFVAKNDDIPNLIQAKWSQLTSGYGAWPYRDHQKNRQSNQSIIDIATALYFVAPIMNPIEALTHPESTKWILSLN